jgi:hypothetical protein
MLFYKLSWVGVNLKFTNEKKLICYQTCTQLTYTVDIQPTPMTTMDNQPIPSPLLELTPTNVYETRK